jgi:hypothetical protein
MASSEKHTWKGLVTAQQNFGLATLVSLLDKKQCEPLGERNDPISLTWLLSTYSMLEKKSPLLGRGGAGKFIFSEYASDWSRNSKDAK